MEGNRIRAKAGSMLVSISRAAREAGLSGMEFASGIPGTLGGGVRLMGLNGHLGVLIADWPSKFYTCNICQRNLCCLIKIDW